MRTGSSFLPCSRQVRLRPGALDTLLGLTGSVFAWSYAVAMPLAGYMADRIPRHRMVIAALISWSLATFGTSVSRDLSELIFWRVMMGLTEALFVPSAFALIATIYPVTARSRAISALGLAQFVGLSIGGMYGGWSATIRLAPWFAISCGHGLSLFDHLNLAVLGIPFSFGTNTWSAPHLSRLCDLFPFCCWPQSFCFLRHALGDLCVASNGSARTIPTESDPKWRDQHTLSADRVGTGSACRRCPGDWAVTKTFTSRIEVALGGVLCCSPFALLIFSHALPIPAANCHLLLRPLFGNFYREHVFMSVRLHTAIS